MSKTVFMRGLQNFISDIRGCQNKEQEQRRVEKELAKVREKFGDDKGLNGYDRRKYVWKLLYIHMLGYDIDFGHKQACDLIPMPKYKDKQVGYMACSLLLKEGDEFLRLAINGIHMDLTSRNEAFECIALNFVGSVGGAEMAEALTQDIIKLVTSGASRPVVKKRAVLCLLKMIRKTPTEQQVVLPDTFCSIIGTLLDETDLGLLLSSMTLLYGILLRNGPVGYESLQSRVIKVLAKLRSPNAASEVPPEYLYYGIPSPWVQSMSLRVLQFYPVPESTADRTALMAQLQDIINRASSADTKSSGGTTVSSQNKNNSMHGILLEAISLCLTMPDLDRDLMVKCVSCLSTSLDSNEANIRYLALENMSRLSVLPDILGAIRQHQVTVIQALRDPDISIRRRALDLAFTVCDSSNAAEIVGELLQYLVTAEFSIREELVLKTAILAEKFASNVQWYVDVILELLERAGDFVSNEIWHRVVQLVSNNEAMQKYAATNVVEKLKRGADHESLVCASAYILGEFGRQIQAETPPMNQFKLLYTQFPAASVQTKGLLLTSFIKIYLLDPHNQELKAEVDQLFERYKKYMDSELQQRATEYMALAARPQEAASNFFLPMPKWPERESTVLRQLQKLEGTYAEDTASLSVGTNGDAITSAPSGQFLVAPPTASPPVQARSMDLLGFDSMPVPGSPGYDPLPAFISCPPPAANHNPVDTLSDLLSESLVSSRAAPYAAPYGSQGSGSLTGTQAPPPAGGWSQPQAFVAPPTMPPPQPSAAHAYDPVYDPFAPATMDAVPGAAMGAGAATAMTNNQLLAYNSAPFAGVGAATAMTNNQLPAYSSDPFAMPTQAARPAYMAAAPPPSSGLFAMAASASAPALMAAPQGGGYDPFAPPPAAPPSIANPFAPPPSVNPFAPPPSVNPTPQSSVTTASVSPQNSVPPVAAAATGAAIGAAVGVGAASWGMGDDPFGDNAFGPPTPPPPPLMPSAQPSGDISAWYAALLLKPRGILYEDQYLQVGVQSSYTRGQGTFTLFLGNKHGEQALTNLSFTITAPSPSVQLNVGPAPVTLAPKQQMQVPIQIMSLTPGVEPPAVHLAYTLCNVVVAQDLRMPVANHKFLVPEPTIPQNFFFDQWRALSQPPNKAQEMFERSGAIESDSVVSVLRAVNFGANHGHLDPSPHNEAGAGYFITGPAGQEQQTLVMCRIEGNPQTMSQFRVTVESSDPTLAATLKDSVVSQLKNLAA